jgi:signal transduction histidine kinase
VTALGKLFRTTAFKFAVVYSFVFGIAAMLVILSVGYNVRKVVDEQISETVDADIRGLADQYAQGGIRQVVESIERRLQRSGEDLYLVTTFNGTSIVGNIANLPNVAFANAALAETTYQRTNDPTPRRALVRVFVLPGGFNLVVGHDIEEREALQRIFNRALWSSLFWLVVIGAIGGLLVARRVLQRVDGISDAARTIMQGDLTERLPINGSGDELDRLAQNLNAMLARITALMIGLRNVSDNIAHDLRTPLTRLRNRAELALRETGDPASLKAALEKVIDESDGMIRIFDALLMIARAEAGTGAAFARVDAQSIVQDVGELYEAAAEEEGVLLTIDATPELWVEGNRELIGQAIANLLDNALKYGRSSDPASPSQIRLSAVLHEDRVDIAVSDHGPGIAPADRGRVTERFVRLEESRSRPGSGLGLSLALAVAHLHGGDLYLEDNQPGLRAVIALPRAAAPSRALPATAPKLPALTP